MKISQTSGVPIYQQIAVYILAPVVEEMVFRGVLLGELLKRINPVVSILFSATIFGLMHGISIHIGYDLICF